MKMISTLWVNSIWWLLYIGFENAIFLCKNGLLTTKILMINCWLLYQTVFLKLVLVNNKLALHEGPEISYADIHSLKFSWEKMENIYM